MNCGTGKDLGLLLFDLLKLNVYYIGSFTVRDTIILAGPLTSWLHFLVLKYSQEKIPETAL